MRRGYGDIMARLYGRALKDNWLRACRNITIQVTESCNMKCHYCVSGDTKIRMSDFTEKRIDRIKDGDAILGFSEYPDPCYRANKTRTDKAIVTKVFKRTVDHALRLTFENGCQLVITENHPILTRRNAYQDTDYVKAGMMKAGHSSAFYLPCPVAVPLKKDRDYKIGFIVACVLGDGLLKEYPHPEYKNCRVRQFRFAVKDDELTNRLWDYLNEFGFNVYKKPFHISTKYDLWKDAIFSNRIDTFEGLSALVRDNFRKNQTTSYYKGFVAGIYDCEGSLSCNTIRICNTNKDIIDEITDGMTRIGVPFTIEESGRTKNFDKKWNVRVMSFKKYTNAMRFLNAVDPSISRKKHEKFYGSALLRRDLKLVSVSKVDGPIEVYNLETTSHTYIANNIAVHNCYQKHKTAKRMPWEVGKAIVDYLFRMWEEDDPDAFISKDTKSIVFDFIGGEPLLEVELMDRICDYFWHEALRRKCIWAETFRIGMISNGVDYFKPAVQDFLKKYRDRLSFGITIDGPQEMHDACRVFPDGSGTWELANAAQKHYHEVYGGYLGTKVTIARENLQYLHGTFRYFADNGYEEFHANPVFEREWTCEDASEYYLQLRMIADDMLSEDKYGAISTSLFTEGIFAPIPETDLQNWCGGTGAMLAFDPDGKAFPCLRYMESSLNGEQEPLCIGDCFDGAYFKQEHRTIRAWLEKIDRRTSCDDECFYCPIAKGCASCAAWNYQKYGTPDRKDKGICWMHRARSLANVYYWNRKYRREGSEKRMPIHLEQENALRIATESDFELLKILSLKGD